MDKEEAEACKEVLSQAHAMAAKWAQVAISADDETLFTVAHVSAAVMIAKANNLELLDFMKILISNWDILRITVSHPDDQELS